MSTHTAICEYYAGATLDAGSLLCHRTTDATVKTASATSEINTGGGVYAVVFTFTQESDAAGSYRLKIKADGEVVNTYDVIFAGVDGEVVEVGMIPRYGDEQRQIQQDKDEATKRVDVIITRTP